MRVFSVCETLESETFVPETIQSEIDQDQPRKYKHRQKWTITLECLINVVPRQFFETFWGVTHALIRVTHDYKIVRFWLKIGTFKSDSNSGFMKYSINLFSFEKSLGMTHANWVDPRLFNRGTKFIRHPRVVLEIFFALFYNATKTGRKQFCKSTDKQF